MVAAFGYGRERGVRKGIAVVALAAALALAAGCGEEDATGGEGGSPDQYELAHEIGYDQCVDPLVNPGRAEEDPVGYAEERFGGSGKFDAAREAGCLEALGGRGQ